MQQFCVLWEVCSLLRDQLYLVWCQYWKEGVLEDYSYLGENFKTWGAEMLLLGFYFNGYLAQEDSTYCAAKYQEMSEEIIHTAQGLHLLRSEQYSVYTH